MERLCSRCSLRPKLANHPAYCQECRRDYAREWRKKNPGTRGRKQDPEEQRKWNTERRARNRGFVLAHKMGKPCVDCGQVFHHSAMHFDHVRGTKELTLSQAMHQTVSLKRLKNEIDKCEIRCAVCHAVRTWATTSDDSEYEPIERYAEEYKELLNREVPT